MKFNHSTRRSYLVHSSQFGSQKSMKEFWQWQLRKCVYGNNISWHNCLFWIRYVVAKVSQCITMRVRDTASTTYIRNTKIYSISGCYVQELSCHLIKLLLILWTDSASFFLKGSYWSKNGCTRKTCSEMLVSAKKHSGRIAIFAQKLKYIF